jgi:tRNA 2-thiouridine synthesizing protein A
MAMSVTFDKVLDARGMSCPMPLVNARKEVGKIDPGQVLKVLATDKGSVADFQGWAKVAKNVELVGQETESIAGANVYAHYIKRTA